MEELEILKAIVAAVAVEMVHCFATVEGAAQSTRHDEPVLGDVSASISHETGYGIVRSHENMHVSLPVSVSAPFPLSRERSALRAALAAKPRVIASPREERAATRQA